MSNYSKFPDINAVLKKSEKLLKVAESEYEESLHKESVSADLLVEIKDFFGNLRSALDYLSKKNCGEDFPICDNQKQFEDKSKNFPPEIKKVLQKWQPFNSNDWLKHFRILNNKSKHLTLVPQKRRETKETRISHPEMGTVGYSNAEFTEKGIVFKGGSYIKLGKGGSIQLGKQPKIMGVPIDPKTNKPIPNDTVKTEEIVWVSFDFDSSISPELPKNISALPFMKFCYKNILQIIKEIEEAMEP